MQNGKREKNKGLGREIFTLSGKEKLNALYGALHALRQRPISEENIQTRFKSDYSSVMLNSAYVIVGNLIKHPKVSSWFGLKTPKLAKQSQRHYRKLTAGQKTYVPAVFNGESYMIADAIRNMLATFDVATDLTPSVTKQIRTIFRNEPAKFLQIIKDNIDFYCNVYAISCESLYQNEPFENLAHQMYEFMRQYLVAAMTITEENMNVFCRQYGEGVQYFIQQIEQFSYQKIIGAKSKVMAEAPYQMNVANFPMMQPCAKELIKQMLDYEAAISRALVYQGQSHLNVVYNAYSNGYQSNQWLDLARKFAKIAADFADEFKQYKTGEHLGALNRSPNEKKIRILQILLNRLNELSELNVPHNESLSERIYKGFLAAIGTYNNNIVISTRLKKSAGYTSKLAMGKAIQCLKLTLEITMANDDEMVTVLDLYRAQVNDAAQEMHWTEDGYDLPYPAVVVDNLRLPIVEQALREQLEYENAQNGAAQPQNESVQLLANNARFLSAPVNHGASRPGAQPQANMSEVPDGPPI